MFFQYAGCLFQNEYHSSHLVSHIQTATHQIFPMLYTHTHTLQNKCISYQQSPLFFLPFPCLNYWHIFCCLCMIMTSCLWYSCLADHVHTASQTLICDDSIVLASALQSFAALGYVKGSGSCENYE